MHLPDANRVAQLEAELAALRTELQDFTYTVSHDLRASLRHVVSYLHLVEEDAGKQLPSEVRGFLQTAADSARHMGTLMDGLQELSRVGAAPLQLAPLALQTLLPEVAAEVSARYAQRDIDWQLVLVSTPVLADAALLRLALHQVLDNAVKFSVGRARTVVRVEQVALGDGRVTLAVQDHGAGFNPALQTRLFKPFARLHSTRQFPGIGMGLALTHKIVLRLGGTLDIAATPDGGCRLLMGLPQA